MLSSGRSAIAGDVDVHKGPISKVEQINELHVGDVGTLPHVYSLKPPLSKNKTNTSLEK